MKHYTDEELNQKIRTFMDEKMERFPELRQVSRDAKPSKRLDFEKTATMHTLLPFQLRMQV